ncbi:F0F1-type ATP synthase membrane subunit b/b' [Microbacterium sp. BE35]|uniref:hypothetical protein n=1 Tax=Microbacterium sp. BE35 TaxID=2817773 RepID=UPI002861283C|nr:hypothetical protein [Microbacterium sp. BE35]MDR7189774.1 F0F1-type ATP synthase membrane subunit b/b' [Microbacterium sp. BE35]
MTDDVTVVTTDDEQIETDEIEETTDVVDEDPSAGLKTALAKERKARREAEARERKAAAALADRDKEPAEQAIEQAKREAREEAQRGFNQRIVTAELKAALSGKVNNAALALKVIDTSVIDVDDNGEVDAQSVTDAIDALLAEYPELAGATVPATRRRIPDVPADPANKPSTPASLSDRIAAAQAAGDTATFIALQNQLLQQQ